MALLTVPNSNNTLIEEEIFVEGTDSFLKYSLSNSISEIEKAINSRAGRDIDLKKVGWTLNYGLSVSVINLMNKHNVNYSMTTYLKNGRRVIVVNRRVENRWYYYTP
jgi:hypothetical protein